MGRHAAMPSNPPPLPDHDLQGALILVLFLVMIGLMYTRRLSALLALPLLGVGVALIGALPYGEALAQLSVEGVGAAWQTLNFKATIIDQVIGQGATRLAGAYTIAIFGGMLAIMIRDRKIAETLIKYAAELSGDSPVKVALLMMTVVALLFTSMGGLGAIIMMGTIIFPIMMSLGVAPLAAAGIFLIGISAGGTLNPGNWALYETSMGIDRQEVQKFAVIVFALYFLTGTVFIVANLRRGTRFWAAPGRVPEARGVRPVALLAPLVPILLSFRMTTLSGLLGTWLGKPLPEAGRPAAEVLADPSVWGFARFALFWDSHIGGWDYIGAFIAGIVFVFLTTYQRGEKNVRTMTRAIIVGAESVMPAVLLMIGLGMVLNGLMNPEVARHLDPYIRTIVPASPLSYVITFALLAPLALYRGPLNLYGLGLGVAALIINAGTMTALPVMAIFMTVGAIQGVCDPTNTHNIWIAAHIGEDVMKILRKTIGYIWVMAALGLIIAAVLFHDQFGEAAVAASGQTP